MWISKKKWQALEKRVADLEGQVQSQLSLDTKKSAEMIKDFLQRRRNEATRDIALKSSL